MSQEHNLYQATEDSESYIKQRLEIYLSIFFNHIYYSEEVEQDIEIEGKRKQGTSTISESYFRYRNTRTYGFSLENYSFELLL